MPTPATRSFDIAPTTKSLTLDSSGKGEFTFTVTNLLSQDVRAQAKAIPEGKAQDKWLTPDPPKDLKVGGTIPVAVRINVPAKDRPPMGAAAVDHAFHLLVSAVDNPNEKYAEGPPVSFKVPPLTGETHNRWWIIVVIAALLLVGGGVAAFLLWPRHEGGDFGAACEDGKCRDHLTCVTRDGAQKCLYAQGEPCKSNGDCASDACTEGKCSALAKAGDPCPTGKCAPGLTCVPRGGAKVCLVALGEACAAPTDCVSGRCDGGKCVEVPVQTACKTPADCDAREICTRRDEGQFCLLKGDQACRTSLDCASRFCRADGTCSDESRRCRDDRDCSKAEGFTCIGGFCNKPPPPPRMSAKEVNIDRMGMDFRNFDLVINSPQACEDQCAADPRCKAWTFVKPNTIQGPRPRCWLKTGVPPGKSHTCCVSGVKLSQ